MIYVWCDKCSKKYKLPKAPKSEIACKACGDGVLTTERPDGAAPPKSVSAAEKPAKSVRSSGGSVATKAPPATSSASSKVKSRKRPANAGNDQAMVGAVGEAFARMKKEIHKKIIGQQEVVELVLINIFAAGHCLLIGVPGLAKTLLVNSISESLGVGFKRIQFTPDLMPSDITGTEVIQDDPDTGQRQYKFLPGPIFTNILLADEINRTPPKTQASLLEAMQEKQVSIGGKVYKLDKPFFVMATQNPVDQEGTYPLPEAQMDRFLFNIFVDYPERDDEVTIARQVTAGTSEDIVSVVTGAEILDYQALIKRAPVADQVLQYAVNLVRATRRGREEAPDFINQHINFGAGPRACLALISAGKARAILHGRYHVSTEDIQAVSNPVLRHRISPNFGAQAEGISSDKLIEMLLDEISPNQ